jgi:glycerol-3-phosphate acyltransferase PlsY
MVIRNITVVISLAVTGAGIWLLSRVHSVVSACNSIASPTSGIGLKTGCQSSLSLYFLGFAFTVGGLVILSLAVFAIHKHRRSEGISHIHRDVNVLDEHFRETYRDVA